MSFYSEMAAIAHEILSEFGQAATLTYLTEGAYDPDTRAPASSSPTTENCTAAVFPLGEDAAAKIAKLTKADALTLTSALEAYLSATELSQEPEPGNVLTVDGKKHTVIIAWNLSPAGTDVLYDLVVSRG